MTTSRLLVIAPQGLGDALEATPFVSALKTAHPDSPIDVLTLRTGPRELFEGLPHLVERVIHLPYWDRGLSAFLLRLGRNVRLNRYARSFLMYPAARPEYHVLGFVLGAGERVAHRYFQPSLANLLWLDTRLVPISAAHNVERNLDLLRATGLQPKCPEGYTVPPEWISKKPRLPSQVAVHIGTVAHNGLESRRWAPERFAELIRRLRRQGLSVVVLAGPEERSETHAVARMSDADAVFEGSLSEVARFLSTCGGLIANDSGIAHLAAGVRTPVLALFGPTPTEHGPYGEHALAFRPSNCPPCFDPRYLNTDCALGIDYACLKGDLTVDLAEKAFLTVIA